MKNATKLVAFIAALIVLGGLGWGGRAAADDKPTSTVSTFKVTGMTCGGCESGVRIKVEKLDGVESVEASYEHRSARVVYDPAKVTPARIIAAIEELGYKAELVETSSQASTQRRSGLRALLGCC